MSILKVDWVAIVQVGRVGAHFKALCKPIIVAPLDLRCLFLRPKQALLNNVYFSEILFCCIDLISKIK